MKLKIISLIVISFLFFGCRSRKLDRLIKTEIHQTAEKIKKDSASEVSETQEKFFVKKQVENNKEESKDTDIEIKGKSQPEKPFVFHQVENGDTISSVKIIGNADFTIKTKTHKSESENQKIAEDKSLNTIQKIARESISKETIKETADAIITEAKRVESSGFQFGAYAALIGWGTATIVVIGLIIYFRKSTLFKTIIDKIRKIKL
jgi:hypothetical protein